MNRFVIKTTLKNTNVIQKEILSGQKLIMLKMIHSSGNTSAYPNADFDGRN